MGTHVPKKQHDGLEEAFENVTFHWLFRVDYWNPHVERVVWRFEDPLVGVTFHCLFSGSMGTHMPKKCHDKLEEPLMNMTSYWLFSWFSMGTHICKK